MMDCVNLSVGGISIRLEADVSQGMTEQFMPFLGSDSDPDYRVIFRQVEQLRSIPEKILYEDHCYRLHQTENGGLVRSFFDAPKDMTPYAVAQYDEQLRQLRVEYLEKGAAIIRNIRSAFFHVGIESLLIQESRMFIHAACVRTPFGGILFSGKSGVGKSTQAEQWCRYRDAKLINGDRPILSKEYAQWRAWGAPYAGSSKCYLNESCPVTAIVMLGQADSCALRRLPSAEAFRAVWSGITVQSWDPFFAERASELVLELISAVPVYEFSCTPDEEAVDYLEQALRKDLGI